MAYNKDLAENVKDLLSSKQDFEMKKMFGGVCYLLHGNMACGVLNDDLIVRVGPDNYDALLQLPDTKKFDITGRPMKGWVMVTGINEKNKEELKNWVEKGAEFALKLPQKTIK